LKHHIESVEARSLVIVRCGGPDNPSAFWRVPVDGWSLFRVQEIAEDQGWESAEKHGNPSRVGSTEPATVVESELDEDEESTDPAWKDSLEKHKKPSLLKIRSHRA